MELLNGVGSIQLGQWRERGGRPGQRVFHLKRRLVEDEVVVSGLIRDIRGTEEALERYEAVRRYLPVGWTAVL